MKTTNTAINSHLKSRVVIEIDGRAADEMAREYIKDSDDGARAGEQDGEDEEECGAAEQEVGGQTSVASLLEIVLGAVCEYTRQSDAEQRE